MKLTKALCVLQAFKKLLSASRFVSKRDTMGDTQDKMTINKNAVIIILYKRKGINGDHDVLLQGKIIFSRKTRYKHQYDRGEERCQ